MSLICLKKIMSSYSAIKNDLMSEIHLNSLESQVYLLVTCNGKMSFEAVSKKLGVSPEDAKKTCKNLMVLGAFIDVSDTEFDAMHPRFTAVNMYRRMCERENVVFGRNKIVDNIGVMLEKPYDDARTK